ncbi:hypothetical protein ADM98_11475 [Exiguobacterium sp. BMC-KP]|uniref:protein YqbG n=1 Tax=Exiguobacterium sp. BMC-KP TaxID=1684312 RepID=UPI0006AA1DA7|nr:DUF3199 family protein [Exiguobacterium sp. BMC-KP]KOP29487.1 hypothetical protein ADM98_11475 [Exiguobacterium sp. BMC-KP]
MPVITPSELRAYTSFDTVKGRTDQQLTDDIIQAEADIFDYVHHEFPTNEYPTVPVRVKLACKKLAEYYALSALDESAVKGYKSEKIGDYSYTMADSAGLRGKPEITALLESYVKPVASEAPQVRMRYL